MKKNKTIRVLVTAIGTVNGSTIIAELKKYDKNIYLIGADINEKESIVSSKFVDDFYVFPSAVEKQEEYLDFVLQFCKNKNIDYIYAVIDEEVCNFSKNFEKFNCVGTKLCLTDYNTVNICHYKNVFYKWLEDNYSDALIKTYYNKDEITKNDLPLFVKPIEGRASIGCHKIETIDELNEIDFNNVVIQQYIEGDVYVVDVIRSRLTKEIQICQRREILRNGNGCGIAIEIVDEPELNILGKGIAEKINLNGIISIELFKYKEMFKIIEINPRLPAGTSYSCFAGCNTVINMLRIAQNAQLLPCNVKIGARFARRYETYEM